MAVNQSDVLAPSPSQRALTASPDTVSANRRRLMALTAAGSAAALWSATEASAQTQAAPTTIAGLINVRSTGAKGDGATDDHAAFQQAVNAAVSTGAGGIFVPPGRYVLSQPVTVPGPIFIQGACGHDYSGLAGSVILPKTTAFMPSAAQATTQLNGFYCQNLVFVGGTIVLDLGLRHECVFRDLMFINASVAAISIVRGERHQFSNVRVYASSVVCAYGLALGSPAVSGIANMASFPFGVDGPWVDRVSIDKLSFLVGPQAYVQHGIYCAGLLSNVTATNVLCQNLRGSALYVGTRLQHSHVTNLIMDGCTVPGGKLISINASEHNVFVNVSPGAAGNNVYKCGIYVFKSLATTFVDCNATGDNVSTYGFWFENPNGQSISMISCQGAVWSNSVNRLQRAMITQLNCVWTASNLEGSTALSSGGGGSLSMVLMSDVNGAQATTGALRLLAATGNGNNQVLLDVSTARAAIGGGAWNGTPVVFGSRYEWYDAAGHKRAKNGAPTSDTDGVVISLNPVL